MAEALLANANAVEMISESFMLALQCVRFGMQIQGVT
jgi:hypothetical protein